MNKYMIKPELGLYPGIRINKDTEFEYKNDNVEQHLKGLKLYTKSSEKTEEYDRDMTVTLHLKEGDHILFDEGRGYYLPVLEVISVDEAIEDLKVLKSLADKE